MKNITEYNEFVKLSKTTTKINEEAEFTTDTGKAGGGGDMYFANVKGNLAGAENTLVGSAVIKLLGFIKRKGIQMYMKKVLKPRLGRVYMNGILRYAEKNHIGNFARKEFFAIKQVVEGKAVKFAEEVAFTYEENSSLRAFVEGATITKKDKQPLEDGKYILNYNGAEFEVSDGKITNIEEGMASESPKDEVKPQEEATDDGLIDTNIPDDEFKKYKDDLKKELDELEKSGVSPEKWAIDECNEIKAKIDTNIDTIDEDDIKLIETERANLLNGVKILSKGIKDINEVLANGEENVPNYADVRYQKLVFTANMKELFNLSDFLSKIITQYNSKSKKKVQPTAEPKVQPTTKPTVKVETTTESFIFEADQPVVVNDQDLKKQNIAPTKKGELDVKTDRLGDELQEIIKSGAVIDLNAESFYKQFESDEVRKGVTQEILKNKAAIAKIELDAERLIGGNAKQQNAWDRMVENVKAMYSKYMITDSVDPKAILKTIPEGELGTMKKENDASPSGKATKDIKSRTELDTIPLWGENTAIQKNLGSQFKDNSYLCTKLTVKGVSNNYIVQKIKKIDDLWFYRVLGAIDLNKIIENKKEYIDGIKKDFKDVIQLGMFSDTIGPKSPKKDGAKIEAVYIVNNKELTYGSNNNTIFLYLYNTMDSGVNFTNATTFYSVKKNNKEKEETKLSGVALDDKIYTFSVEIKELDTWHITYPDSAFGIDTNSKFDISKEPSVKKMSGLKTLFK